MYYQPFGIEEMVYGTMTLPYPDVLACLQGIGEILLGKGHGITELTATGYIGGDGRGERAAGAMGVRIIDPFSTEPVGMSFKVEQIICIIEIVSALAEHGAVIGI